MVYNAWMLTELMIKNSKDIVFTGLVKYKKIPRTSFSGVKNNKPKDLAKKAQEAAYTISFEIETTKGLVFFDLYNQKGRVREFATMMAIEKFLKKLSMIKSDFDIKGTINCK